MPVSKDQAQQLASLACAARPHGAPRWDAPGVMDAIGKVKHLHLADVAMAVMRAADDRTVNTPGVIGNPRSPCWRERNADRPEQWQPDPIPANERCTVCSKRRPDCERVRFADDDHKFEPASTDQRRPADAMAVIVEEARNRLAPTNRPTEPEPVPPDPRVEELRQQLHPVTTPPTDNPHTETKETR